MKVEFKVLKHKNKYQVGVASIVAEPDSVVGVYIDDPEDMYIISYNDVNVLAVLSKHLKEDSITPNDTYNRTENR